MKKDEMKKQYESITVLYDMAEELAKTVENIPAKFQEAHLATVEPLINDIADSTDALSEEYINVLENPAQKKNAKTRIEKALRHIYIALEEYSKRMKETTGETLAAVSKLTDPILKKIHQQTEKILIIFMRLMEISLERIMPKHDLDEFKRHNEQLFNSLPQHSY